MTSTPFNVGLGDGSRLSSRVLRPPGGGHTDIFGGEPEPPRTGRRLVPNAAAAKTEQSLPANNSSEAPKHNGQEISQAPVENVPQDKPAPPPKIDSEPAKSEPAKRVRVPPGGFSSGLW